MNDLHEVVVASYRALLGRDPESVEIIEHFAALGSAFEIIRQVSISAEAAIYRPFKRESPFFNYASLFDAEQLIHRYAKRNLTSDPEVLINFLGVRIEERYLPQILSGKSGTVEDLPIPANWHADIAEWGAALRAVDLADEVFVVAELGCGWGCWLNNTGVAARDRGLTPKLIGIEADRGHLQFAQRCCFQNKFTFGQVELHHGVAAAEEGVALFPKQIESGENWGLQPIFGATTAERNAASASSLYEELPMIPIEQLIGDNIKLDLLHIDIQGGEAVLLEQAFDIIAKKVSYVVVGTHSREIEGRLTRVMSHNNWRLEIERPAIVRLLNDGPLTLVDGVQGWRNMNLIPD